MVGYRTGVPLQLVHRHLTPEIERALRDTRIVNLVGPRQSGKTELVRGQLRHAAYVPLADDKVLLSLREDPYGHLKELSVDAGETGLPVAIDDVQRFPGLALPLKRVVDEDGRPGQFLLAGTSDVFTSRRSDDSLAGRVSTLRLRPMSAAEMQGAGPCLLLDAAASREPPETLPRPRPVGRGELLDLLLRGGLPEKVMLSGAAGVRDYVGEVIRKDVAEVVPVRKLEAMLGLVGLSASMTAREFNAQEFARRLAVKGETVTCYIEALRETGIVHRLGAWISGREKREVRSPKLHFMDAGLAAALRGEHRGSFGLGSDPADLGALFETFVFTELEKSLPFQETRWRLWHWRSEDRRIDVLAEAPSGDLALFRTRATSKVGPDDFRHIDWFMSEGPGNGRRCSGFVVYFGEHVLSFGPGKTALPISSLWS